MPADSHLGPIYNLICNTWVIGVDHEPISFQVSYKLLVKKQGIPEEPIYCLLHLDIQYGCFLPVG
jgi:hypothetical protein